MTQSPVPDGSSSKPKHGSHSIEPASSKSGSPHVPGTYGDRVVENAKDPSPKTRTESNRTDSLSHADPDSDSSGQESKLLVNTVSDNGDDRDPVEMLADEFVERLRQGQCVTIEEFANSYPNLASRIRDLFPVVAAMEGLRLRKDQIHEGTSLGPVAIERLGDFRIIRKLGRGGMGVVFEAEQESLKRRVAVKVLPPLMLQSPKQLERFRREAQTVARLHHTNIVQAFGVGEHNGIQYFVMQYIDGVGLDQVLKSDEQVESLISPPPVNPVTWTSADESRHKPTSTQLGARSPNSVELDAHDELTDESEEQVDDSSSARSRALRIRQVRSMLRDPQFVSRILMQVAEAVSFAHGQGVLHCDLKPGNLLLDVSDHVWIVDFGLAKVLQRNAAYITGQMSGTLRYMAPELLFGKRVDVRCDVYSLGITLYELLTGRAAFGARDRGELVKKIEHGDLGSPRAVCSTVPRDLESIVQKATETRPEDRYQTALEFAEDLKAYLNDRPVQARNSSYIERCLRWIRRNRMISGLTALSLVLFLTVAGLALYGVASIRSAFIREASERARAESTSRLASEALDKVFLRFRHIGIGELVQSSSLGAGAQSSEELLTQFIPTQTQPDLSKDTVHLLQDLLRYYDQLSKLYESDPTLSMNVTRARWAVGDIHQRLGQYEQAIQTYERILASISQPSDRRQMDRQLMGSGRSDSALVALQSARLHNEIGSALRQLGRSDSAKASHRDALRQLSQLSKEQESQPLVQFELARTKFLLARRLRPGMGPESMPPPVALRLPPTGRRRINEQLNSVQAGGTSSNQTTAVNRSSVEFPAVQQNSTTQPLDSDLDEAVRILKLLISKSPTNPAYRQLLAICYREAAEDVLAQQTAGDMAHHKIAMELLEKLVDEYPDVADFRFELMETYSEMSVFGASLNEKFYESARTRLVAALQQGEILLANYPQVNRYMVTLMHANFKLSVVLAEIARQERDLSSQVQLKESEQYARRAIELQQLLLKRHPKSLGNIVWLGLFRDWHGRVLRELGRLPESRLALESAASELKSQVIGRRDLVPGLELLGNIYENLSETLASMGDMTAAEAEHVTAEDWWKRARQQEVNP